MQGGLLTGGCAALASLSGLEDLRITGMDHIKTAQTTLQSLTSLSTLSFFNCDFSDEDLQPLAALAGLQEVQFMHCMSIVGAGRSSRACVVQRLPFFSSTLAVWKSQLLNLPNIERWGDTRCYFDGKVRALEVFVIWPRVGACNYMPHTSPGYSALHLVASPKPPRLSRLCVLPKAAPAQPPHGFGATVGASGLPDATQAAANPSGWASEPGLPSVGQHSAP